MKYLISRSLVVPWLRCCSLLFAAPIVSSKNVPNPNMFLLNSHIEFLKMHDAL
jgi:flagellar biosynthesis protein FliR